MIFKSYGIHNPIICHIDLIKRIGQEFIDIGCCEEVLVRDFRLVETLESGEVSVILYSSKYNVTDANKPPKQFRIKHADIDGKPLDEVVTFIRQRYEEVLFGNPIDKPIDPLRSAKGAFE